MHSITARTRIYEQHGVTRILVVEEEPIVAIMLDDALSDFGYHILGPVENQNAAIYLAATEDIDVAVVDTNTGREISEAVTDKLTERGIPFVFVRSQPCMFSLHHSAIPLMQEPFTVDGLHQTITRLLQQTA